MEIKDRVKKLRKSKGLSQTSLAKEVGVSQGAITKIEQGRLSEPTFIVKMAKVLGVSAEYLLYGDNEVGSVNHTPELPATLQPLPVSTIQIPILKWEDFPSLVSSSFASLTELLNKRLENGEYYTMFKKPNEKLSESVCAIKADNDAMVPNHSHPRAIYPTDWLIIDFYREAQPNDIVLAQYGDQVFIRQFVQDGSKRILKPLNAQYQLIDIGMAKIHGVVTKIIKELD